jgi:hypothetical protein
MEKSADRISNKRWRGLLLRDLRNCYHGEVSSPVKEAHHLHRDVACMHTAALAYTIGRTTGDFASREKACLRIHPEHVHLPEAFAVAVKVQH